MNFISRILGRARGRTTAPADISSTTRNPVPTPQARPAERIPVAAAASRPAPARPASRVAPVTARRPEPDRSGSEATFDAEPVVTALMEMTRTPASESAPVESRACEMPSTVHHSPVVHHAPVHTPVDTTPATTYSDPGSSPSCD